MTSIHIFYSASTPKRTDVSNIIKGKVNPQPTRNCTRRTILSLPSLALLKAAPALQLEALKIITPPGSPFSGWPTLTRRSNGELLVVYSGGREAHVCPFGRVELIRSRDEGRTWSHPQIILDTPIDDRDAGIVETPRGTLLVTTFTSLVYEKQLQAATNWDPARLERWQSAERATTPEQRKSLLGAWMLRSTDGGLTWSTPYRVPVTSPHGVIATKDGRLLYAGKAYPDASGEIGVCESTDDGITWHWLAKIPSRGTDLPRDYHELHAAEASNGTLIAHIRNHNQPNAQETLQSESVDGGKSWTIPHTIGVWGLPSHLLRLKDARLLMSYGYRRAPRGNQIRLSEDNARTWSAPCILSDDGTGDLGYPSTVELDNGQLLTLWYEVTKPATPAILRTARYRLN